MFEIYAAKQYFNIFRNLKATNSLFGNSIFVKKHLSFGSITQLRNKELEMEKKLERKKTTGDEVK